MCVPEIILAIAITLLFRKLYELCNPTMPVSESPITQTIRKPEPTAPLLNYATHPSPHNEDTSSNIDPTTTNHRPTKTHIDINTPTTRSHHPTNPASPTPHRGSLICIEGLG